jgi:hypothetical protein
VSEPTSREIVQEFLASGLSEEFVTEDFIWRIPPSLVSPGNHDFRREGLATQIHEIHEKIYDVPTMKSTVDFIIGEGEWVAYQFEVEARTRGGEPYHNYYCLTFRLRDGK